MDSRNRPRPYSTSSDREGSMYDEKSSNSNTNDRRRSSSQSPSKWNSHDRPRSPPRGPAASRYSERGWKGRDNRSSNLEDRRRVERSRSPRGRYRDRDREGYRSPRDDYQSRSRSRPRHRSRERTTRARVQPSRDVIMEGLPLDMQEEDIKYELQKDYHVEGLQEVRIIRDRNTGISRQFGFLQFVSTDASSLFIETNQSQIYLHDPHARSDAEAARIHIDFSRQTESEWKCRKCTFSNFSTRTECYRCQEPKIVSNPTVSQLAPAKPSDFLNTGDSDVSTSDSASQYLLFRGLDASVTEALLAKGAAKLYKSTDALEGGTAKNLKKPNSKVASTASDSILGAREQSILRILLVRDRVTDESWRYGFVEFAAPDEAKAALTKYNSMDKYTIASKPVLVSFIHAGVFVPAWNYDDSKIRFTFGLSGNPAMKLAYWDEDAYVTELRQHDNMERSLMDQPLAENQSDKRGSSGDQKESSNVSKNIDSEASSKKRKTESAATAGGKKAVPAHLQFWSNRHAELHGITRSEPSENGEDNVDSDNVESTPKSKSNDRPRDISRQDLPTQSFADRERKCCLLCSRQFKSDAEVNKHERLSKLHQDNLKRDDVRSKAMAKLGIPKPGSLQDSEYRDRAKERRQAFNQPKQAASQKHHVSSGVDSPKDDKPDPVAPSKGAALLGKMGWSAGSGLGAQGTGMLAPVATDMYVQGVGLGAQGGKVGDAVDEAIRSTKGDYKGFVDKTKERAKERYDQLT